MLVLGIETSCDETAVSIVSDKREILSNEVWSQMDLHQIYGGVVPEIAARNHVMNIDQVILQALSTAQISFQDLDGICGTAGPGLSGGLIVGLTAAKSLALTLKKPFYAVNHLEGHALTVQLTNNLNPPYLLLLISGGHTQLVMVSKLGHYTLLGSTLDDALGECFDKLAKMLNLTPFSGKTIEYYARQGNPKKFILPKPMSGQKDCNFSFSGLKSFIRNLLQQTPIQQHQQKADLCASFQEAIIKILIKKTQHAIKLTQGLTQYLVIAGGVASNQQIQAALTVLATENNMQLIYPPSNFCTDNAAMIAWVGLQYLQQSISTSLDFGIKPQWPLELINNF